MNIKPLSLLLRLILLVPIQVHAEGIDLTATFTQVSSKGGQIVYSLYNSEATYKSESGEALGGKIQSTPGTAQVVIHDVNPGTYALTAFHDENENGILDTGPFGITKEQFGISNITRTLWAKPSWDEVKFDVKLGESNEISILMKKH